MTKQMIINVKPGGTTQFIYDDRLRGLLAEGKAEVKRASMVEPGSPTLGQDPLKWYADMAPSGGGVLGPFDTRQGALDAEVAWINRHVLIVASTTSGNETSVSPNVCDTMSEP